MDAALGNLHDGSLKQTPGAHDDSPRKHAAAAAAAVAAVNTATAANSTTTTKPRVRNRKKDSASVSEDSSKRRCVSTACIACRRRKSKCDGATPSCAACSSVYNTECVYDPGSDHRRKGVYKKDIDNLKTRNSTLQTLIQAILNYPEDEVPELVRQIRTCESLDTVAEAIIAKENGLEEEDDDTVMDTGGEFTGTTPMFEKQLSGKMGALRLEHGSTRYIGGTSHLILLGPGSDSEDSVTLEQHEQQDDPISSWTDVTSDPDLIVHLINMYFTWHYTYFTTLSKDLFYRDFLLGRQPYAGRRRTEYCTPLLVNAILALGCHFTSRPGTRVDPDDPATAGDHFFREAKRLIMENDEHEMPKITTVQALALLSVREAGCGREAKGWVYSGMSFRMACDLGLNLDSGVLSLGRDSDMDEADEDARRVTFWGCFLFDKYVHMQSELLSALEFDANHVTRCWSNYLGRLPQLPPSIVTVPKIDVFPDEDADEWSAYTDAGHNKQHAQPCRTRAIAVQITGLCEISSDLMAAFYNPIDMDKPKGKQAELKKLSELHQRLEAWRRDLPKEFEPKEGSLPQLLVMHMFFQMLYIHLFRPFLKYNKETSPLPAHVSPRKLCTQAAAMISKLFRLYKRSHGLRQICNIAVYIGHSACTIHLLNLPDKNAKRDIVHGVKHMEEIAEGWICARRTLSILSVLAKKWKVQDLPEEATSVLQRNDARFGAWHVDTHSPRPSAATPPPHAPPPLQYSVPQTHLQSPQRPSYHPNYMSGAPSVGIATTMGYRRLSDPHSLPPRTAADIQFPRQPSGPQSEVKTPSSDRVSRRSIDSTGATNTTGASPSELFGGVDQLLRDSQDWWLRDQNQLALGFDNWVLPADGLDAWSLNGSNGHNVVANGSVNDQTVPNGRNGINGGAALNGTGAANGFAPGYGFNGIPHPGQGYENLETLDGSDGFW